MQQLAVTNHWAETFAGKSREELRRKRTELEATIKEGASQELSRRFDCGEFDVIGQGTKYVDREPNPFDVYSVRIPSGGPIQRATLPDDATYSSIYGMRAQSIWLEERASTMALMHAGNTR